MLSSVLVAVAAPALAEPITTDRPDIAESSLAMGAGAYQLEQGTSYEATGLSFPSLQRLGIGSNVELRLETPIVTLSGAQAAFTEVGLGAKWHFMDGGELGQMPSMGLIGHAVINNLGQVEPVFKLAADTSLPLDVDLGMNVGASLPPGNTAPAINYAASLSRSLTDTFRVYVEASGVNDLTANASELGVDGGMALLLDESLQLDMAVYKGLTATSTDWYVGAGISKRWGE